MENAFFLILFVLIFVVAITYIPPFAPVLEKPRNDPDNFAMAQLREIACDLSVAPYIRVRAAATILEWS